MAYFCTQLSWNTNTLTCKGMSSVAVVFVIVTTTSTQCRRLCWMVKDHSSIPDVMHSSSFLTALSDLGPKNKTAKPTVTPFLTLHIMKCRHPIMSILYVLHVVDCSTYQDLISTYYIIFFMWFTMPLCSTVLQLYLYFVVKMSQGPHSRLRLTKMIDYYFTTAGARTFFLCVKIRQVTERSEF